MKLKLISKGIVLLLIGTLSVALIDNGNIEEPVSKEFEAAQEVVSATSGRAVSSSAYCSSEDCYLNLDHGSGTKSCVVVTKYGDLHTFFITSSQEISHRYSSDSGESYFTVTTSSGYNYEDLDCDYNPYYDDIYVVMVDPGSTSTIHYLYYNSGSSTSSSYYGGFSVSNWVPEVKVTADGKRRATSGAYVSYVECTSGSGNSYSQCSDSEINVRRLSGSSYNSEVAVIGTGIVDYNAYYVHDITLYSTSSSAYLHVFYRQSDDMAFSSSDPPCYNTAKASVSSSGSIGSFSSGTARCFTAGGTDIKEMQIEARRYSTSSTTMFAMQYGTSVYMTDGTCGTSTCTTPTGWSSYSSAYHPVLSVDGASYYGSTSGGYFRMGYTSSSGSGYYVHARTSASSPGSWSADYVDSGVSTSYRGGMYACQPGQTASSSNTWSGCSSYRLGSSVYSGVPVAEVSVSSVRSFSIDGSTKSAGYYYFGLDVSHTIGGPTSTSGGTRYTYAGFSISSNDADCSASGNYLNCDDPDADATTVTISWNTEYQLSTSNGGHGSVSTSPSASGGWYDSGDGVTVSISGSPTSGTTTRYKFDRWSGCSTSTSTSVYVTMSSAKTCTATWTTQYKLTTSNGGHGTISPTTGQWYDSGDNVAVRMNTGTVTESSGKTRHVFSSWSGDCTGTSYSSTYVSMSSPKSCTASWDTEHYVDLGNGGKSATTSPTDGWYTSNTPITISISPDVVNQGTGTRYAFDSWSGSNCGSSSQSSQSSFTITLNAPVDCTATWTTQYKLTVNDGGHGTVSSNPVSSGYWFDSATSVRLRLTAEYDTASADSRHRFLSWSGDCSGSSYSNSNPITMNGPKTCSLVWDQEYRILISAGGRGTTTPTEGEYWYADAETKTIEIDQTPVVDSSGRTRWSFTAWSGSRDCNGATDSSLNVVIQGPMTCTATWQTEHQLQTMTPYSEITTNPSTQWHGEGTTVVLTLTATEQMSGADTRYSFDRWSGDCSGTDSSSSVTMVAPLTCNADWISEYLLTQVNDPVAVSVSASGQDWVTDGECGYLSIDAQSTSVDGGTRYIFDHWSLGGTTYGTSSTQSDCVVMNGPKVLTANWNVQHKVTVAVSPSELSPSLTVGTASLTQFPAELWIDDGFILSLSSPASSSRGGDEYTFLQWTLPSGAETARQTSVVISSPAELVANFQPPAPANDNEACSISLPTPEEGGISSSRTPTISANWYDASGIDLDSVDILLDDIDVTTQSTLSAASFSYTPQTDLSVGAHSVQVTAKDDSASKNGCSLSWSFTVLAEPDRLPPEVTDEFPVDGSRSLPTSPINVCFSDVTGLDHSTLILILDDADVTAQASFNVDCVFYNHPTPLTEGSHTVKAIVTDSSPQSNTVTHEWSFTTVWEEDSAACTISQNVPVDSITERSPQIGAQYTDDWGVNLSSVQLIIDGFDVTSSRSTVMNSNGISYVPASNMAYGEHHVNLSMQDVSSNRNECSLAWSFEIEDPNSGGKSDAGLADVSGMLNLVLLIILCMAALMVAAMVIRRKRTADTDTIDTWGERDITRSSGVEVQSTDVGAYSLGDPHTSDAGQMLAPPPAGLEMPLPPPLPVLKMPPTIGLNTLPLPSLEMPQMQDAQVIGSADPSSNVVVTPDGYEWIQNSDGSTFYREAHSNNEWQQWLG